MKKSLLSIITLALVVVNLILSVLLVFSVMPASKKTDKMVTQICSILDLELESQKKDEPADIPMEQKEQYAIADQFKLTLKDEGDGEVHFAALSVTLVMNNKDKDYKKYSATISEKEDIIRDKIIAVVSNHTYSELQTGQEDLKKEILKSIQEMYDSKFIVEVVFKEFAIQ